MKVFMIAVIAACVFGSLINQTSAAAAEPTQVEPPLRLTVAPAGAERLRGWLTSYDDTGFAMKTASGEVARVAWRDLPSERVMWVQEKILDRGDARGWFILAAMLYPREDGRAPGELALRRALNADPGLASKAERLRDGEPVDIDEPEPETPSSPEDGHRHADGNAGGQGEGGPVAIGELESQFWGELSEELMAQSVEDIKARMAEAQRVLNQRLPLYEEASDYFLFYSDLPPREAKQWAGLLDKMYDRLCKIFDLEQGKNIFRGRGLIIVFRHELDYHRYQAMVHGMLGSEGTAGLCRSFGDGHVEVTFFKQNNDLDFARVLVHEAVHAFVHRYRSYPFVDSWINEGLAEYVSSALVDNSGFGDTSWSRSLEFGKQSLRDRKSFGGNSFFYASHIDGWQYPLAHMLTAFMIQQDGQRYRAFINAIKDGKKWDVAMEEDYGVELETLVEAFGRSLKIRDLKP